MPFWLCIDTHNGDSIPDKNTDVCCLGSPSAIPLEILEFAPNIKHMPGKGHFPNMCYGLLTA
jgi:hypothetical protein